MYATAVFCQIFSVLSKSHLDKIQHLYCYLNKNTSIFIKFNTQISLYYNFKTINGNWRNLYAGNPEDLPHSCPPPMGKTVLISTFVDDNFMADLTTGRSQTGSIYILNNTTIKW